MIGLKSEAPPTAPDLECGLRPTLLVGVLGYLSWSVWLLVSPIAALRDAPARAPAAEPTPGDDAAARAVVRVSAGA